VVGIVSNKREAWGCMGKVHGWKKKHSLNLKKYTLAKFWSIIIYNRLSVYCCFSYVGEHLLAQEKLGSFLCS
jgi:hypothetical protein